jgi:beta-phosphoglucomutase-like phosphatase (HAD superfamily)
LNNLDFLKKYKLFIVDYDGTILDSMNMWKTTLSNFLKSENIIFDEDIDEVSKEQTNIESVKYINEKYFPNLTFDELSTKMYDFVRKEYVKQELKENANILLKEIKNIGRVVLFSATATELLNDSFKVNNIDNYFDFVYSASEMNTTKVDGIGFNKVLELENIKKEDALIIEDVFHAIKGAKLQNFDVLAIYDNQRSWNKIISVADYNLDLSKLI